MSWSEESNKKRSDTLKKFWASSKGQEILQKRLNKYSGDANPAKRPDVRKKISEKRKGQPAWNKGLTKETDSRVANHSLAMQGRSHSKTHNRRVSEAKFNSWQDPVFREKMITASRQGQHVSQNKAELFLQQILDEHFPNQWKFVGDGKRIVAGKCPDFVHTSRPLLIELFGDYWHSEEITGVPKEQHEKERIQLFESKGYRCLVVWECALEDANLIKRIQNFEMES